jgi:hypothetical protein
MITSLWVLKLNPFRQAIVALTVRIFALIRYRLSGVDFNAGVANRQD